MAGSYNAAGLTMIAEYIGEEAARKLCKAWGGCQIKVPKGRSGKWWRRLSHVLGERDAAELCAAFGGEVIYVPRNSVSDRDAIRERVNELLNRGMTYAEIAKSVTFEVSYTERGLRKLMEKQNP